MTFAIFMLFYNRRITRAIVEISNEVRQIGDGNLQLQLVASGDDELARLTESVEEMRRSILKKTADQQQALKQNQELISAMSHDIRNPLTALLGYLDLAQSGQYSSQEAYQRKGDILIVKANAKINLMLDITGVKKNGYHKLYTIMQSLNLCDILKTERTSGEKIVISCSDEKIPTDRKNIAYKCAAAFFDAAKIESGRGVKIHIEKNIPSEAGMGGGSADGAAVLVSLNRLFGEKLSQKELIKIGAFVGADIPFILVEERRFALI